MLKIARSGRCCPIRLAFCLLIAAWVLMCLAGPVQAQAPKSADPGKAEPTAKPGEGAKTAEGAEPPTVEPTPQEPFKVLPADDSLRKNQSRVRSALKDGDFSKMSSQEFDAYFRSFFFPQWSYVDRWKAVDGGGQPRLRFEMLTFQRNSKSGQPPHKLFNAVALRELGNLATGHYHPAVRVNAMLMIGELNAIETPPGDPNVVPTPLPAALPVLAAAVEDSSQPDAVRVAALVGILRHARGGDVPPDELRKALIAMVQAASPPPGRTPEGHAWMRGLAAEVLGESGGVGAVGAVADALAAMAADTRLTFSARCAAARALARLDYPSGGVQQPRKLAEALCQLASDACAAEEGQLLRRRLIERLSAVATAISGTVDVTEKKIGPGVASLEGDAAQKQFVSEIQSAVQALIKDLDDKKIDEDTLAQRIAEARDNLQKLLKK